MSKFLDEFKEFALKGNMVDLAVGVIIGGAFSSLVSSMVSNIVMPALSIVTGRIDFSNMFFALNGEHYATLEAAQAETSAIAYGLFLTQVIDFIIMAFVVFLFVRTLNNIRKRSEKPAAPAAPTEKECPMCLSKISIKARRCPFCTSLLSDEAMAELKKD